MKTPIATELRDLRLLAEIGEQLDLDALSSILARVPEEASLLSQQELKEIKAEVDGLYQLAEEQRDDLAERLEVLHRGRIGAQGYNHLKTLHVAQRLSKRI